MRNFYLFIMCLFSTSVLIGQTCVNNPSVQAGDLDPAPLYPEAIGTASFTYFENLTDYADWETDPVKMTVCFLHTTPTMGASSVSGTAAPWFDWLYDPISNCLLAKQNRTIVGGTGGSINVGFDITNPVECESMANQMGFVVNVQPAACMNETNETTDDSESVYTCFDSNGTPPPTSLREQKLAHLSISLFPNPASKSITLDINSVQPTQRADLVITDILGRTVQTVKAQTIDQGQNSFLLDVSSISNGTYFVVVEGKEGNLATVKFIKNAE